MKKINVDISLRPIRFGFVVNPTDSKSLLEIFRINTCLWGGMYNPIIPYFKKIPEWWERDGYKFENADQIINGYLDFFEPDFIVEAEKGIASCLNYEQNRVLQLSDLLINDTEKNHRYGLSVTEVYQHLYRNEFQFIHKRKPNFIHIRPSKDINLFSACIFGSFPQHKNVNYYESFYKEVFSPQEIHLDGNKLKELYESEYWCPLKITSANIQIKNNYRIDPSLIILDANKPYDLIDFWNLRTITNNILAIPMQWLENISDFSKEFIINNYRPLPNNPNGVMIHPTVIFSRSIKESKAHELFKNHIQVDKKGANTLQIWYPPIWRSTPEHTIRKTRATLCSSKKELEVSIEENQTDIKFELMSPEFITNRHNVGHRWANSIRLTEQSNENQLALVFPTDYKRSTLLNISFAEIIISSTEGFIVFPKLFDSHAYWRLQNGDVAFANWFKEKDIQINLSKSGRSAQQIIQTLGGFFHLDSIANQEIILLLDNLAKKQNKCATYHKFYNEGIKKIVKRDQLKYRYFEILVDQKVVELGLEVKCSLCDSWNWYKLNKLNATIDCDFCLKSYKFPVKNPLETNEIRWAYRVIGPFAMNKFADGGYATALSLRFFGSVFSTGLPHAGITWSTGMELLFSDKTRIESDFLIWYQRKSIFCLNYPTEFIFGETKSFGKESFGKKDIARMKILAKKFPGSILVFSTMKDSLSKYEIQQIRKLAEWGRKHIKNQRTTQAPVIILTGTELFSERFLKISWKNKGGKHEKLAELLNHDIKQLADLTQQLYLNMPSYFSWMEEKHDKHRSKTKT